MADTIWTVTDTAVATDDTTSSNTLSPLGTDDVSNGPNSYVAITDTFAGRTVSGGWGTTSDGKGSYTSTNANFSVGSNEGQVLNDATFPTGFIASSFAPTTNLFLDVDLLVRFTLGASGDDFIPVIRNLTINSLSNQIDINIQATLYLMEVNKNGHKFSTPTVSFTCTPGTFYWTRLQAIGNVARSRVWADGASEPSTWGITVLVNDNMHSGSTGLKFKSTSVVNPVQVDSLVLTQLGGPTLETSTMTLKATFTDDLSSTSSVLAVTDTFAGRTVSGGWGTTSDGQAVWQTSNAALSVSGGEGQGLNSSATVSNILGTINYTDTEVLCRFSLQVNFDQFRLNFRRAADLIDIIFRKDVGWAWSIWKSGHETLSSFTSPTYTAGAFYWTRTRVLGNTFFVKVWADGSSEPGPWTGTILINDNMTQGTVGTSILSFSTTIPVTVDSFTLTNLGGPAPDSLTPNVQFTSTDTLTSNDSATAYQEVVTFTDPSLSPPPDSLIQTVPLNNTESVTVSDTSNVALNTTLADTLTVSETPAYSEVLTRTHSVTSQETPVLALNITMADSGDVLTCSETFSASLALTISDSLTLAETSVIAYGFTDSLTTLAETSSYALNYAGIDTPTLGDSMSVSPTTLFTDDVSGGSNSYVALTDTFAGRTVSGGWGTTSDGKGFYTSTNANFSVSGNEGQVLNDVTFPTGFLAPSFAPTTNLFLDVDLLVRFTLGSTTDAFFPVLRNLTINSLANLANLNIQNTFYVMEINKNGHKFVSPNVSFTCTPGTFYWVRFQAVGNIVRGRVWADGSGEPGTWGVTSIINDNMNSGSTGLKFKSASAVNPVKVDSMVLTQLGGPTLDVLSPALQLSGTDQLTVSETFVPAQNIAVTDQLTVQETGQLLSIVQPINDVPLVVSDVSVLALAVTRTDTLTLSETSGSTLLFVPLDALSATEISGQQKTYVMQLGGVIILTSNFISINTTFTDSLVPSEPSIVLLAAHIGTDTLSIIEAVSMYPELYIIILQVMRTGIVTQHI